MNIRIYLIFLATTIIGPHFAADSIGLNVLLLIDYCIYWQFVGNLPEVLTKTEILRWTQATITCHRINNLAVKNFTKRLNACAKAGSGYFEYSDWLAKCLMFIMTFEWMTMSFRTTNTMCHPFCNLSTWETTPTMWSQKTSNKFVIVRMKCHAIGHC